jgi:DNA-binding MurR/RpiR family transcriptional regulator
MTTKPEMLSRIEATFSQLTPSEKRVGSWLLAHAAQIPFETAESVGLASGTSGITVGRFLRKLGYRNLEDAKKSLRDPYQPWGMNERLDSWQQQRPLPNRLQHALSLEVDAITQVYQLAQTDAFRRSCTTWPMRMRYLCWGSSPRAGSPTPSSATLNTCARA